MIRNLRAIVCSYKKLVLSAEIPRYYVRTHHTAMFLHVYHAIQSYRYRTSERENTRTYSNIVYFLIYRVRIAVVQSADNIAHDAHLSNSA